MINIVLSGMMGKMGSMIARDILISDNFNLVGSIVAPDEIEHARKLLENHGANTTQVSSQIHTVFMAEPVDVYLDFSVLDAAKINLPRVAEKRVPSIIGVSGFAEDDYEWMETLARDHDVPILLVPNFSIGLLLAKKMALMARTYYPTVELVETHHDRKRDAPSGTSYDIATNLAKIEPPQSDHPPVDELDMGGCRGMPFKDVKVHSLRLPGVIAKQQIIFSRRGEVLTVTHETTSRESFLAGIYFAIENVTNLKGFNIGLETILDI